MTFVEPTAAVILALEPDGQSRSRVQRARERLAALRHADGGWGIAAPDAESGWMTAWAVRALAGADHNAAADGAEWLLRQAGIRLTDPKEIEWARTVLHIDPTVTGWAWQTNDAAWIFPTALSLLALHDAGIDGHPRVSEAQKYLLDRAIPGGGWNIGNPFMVTGNLAPTVENTVMALLALDAGGVIDDAVARAQAWLARDDFTPTPFEWAWRAWYWDRSRTQPAKLQQAQVALAGLQSEDGSWNSNPFTTAVALLGGAGA